MLYNSSVWNQYPAYKSISHKSHSKSKIIFESIIFEYMYQLKTSNESTKDYNFINLHEYLKVFE